ncbi:MAG TPA: amidohydrolase [bacterium]|nr:amidohydrolase [bacterium]
MQGTLFLNGRIHTMDPVHPAAGALAVSDGRILAAGRGSELRDAFPNFALVDLGGRTVVPGFTDSHIHLPAYGIGLHRVELRHTGSVREAVERVREVVARMPSGRWVRGQGWDKNIWEDDRFPTRHDLDPVSPTTPVALSSKDGHLLWVNTAALRIAGIDRRTAAPPGGAIGRDARGEPTGVLKETAKDLVWGAVPAVEADEIEDGIRAAQAVMHRLGITAVHNFVGTSSYDGGTTFAAFRRLAARGELRLRVWATIPEGGLEHAAALGLHTGFGDEWLRIGPVKIFADGTLGSQTAVMLEPFEGQPDNLGIAIHTQEELVQLVGRAVAAGFWCAIHAIGDRANRWVLDAYETHHRASRAQGARHRIEHVQVIHRDDLPRLSSLGVIASMQPIHCTTDRDIADRYWGARSRFAYAWQSLRRAGTRLVFGSDAPVETPDVFQGLYAAVTRKRAEEPDRPAWYPDESLPLDEALRAYTEMPAYAAGTEAFMGRLMEGYLADFVVLEGDPLTGPPEALLRAEVAATVVAGTLVYAGSGFAG